MTTTLEQLQAGAHKAYIEYHGIADADITDGEVNMLNSIVAEAFRAGQEAEQARVWEILEPKAEHGVYGIELNTLLEALKSNQLP